MKQVANKAERERERRDSREQKT